MKTVLITGAAGFIGRNLVAALKRRDDVRLILSDVDTAPTVLDAGLADSDIIYHLAGVNRPKDESEFLTGNAGLTERMLTRLVELGRTPVFILSSSMQAELDNPYGRSKKVAEDAVSKFGDKAGAPVCIYRLPGVFGKGSRPNYNTVVATFCHNIARGMQISVNDPNRELELVYIDDVISAFLRHLDVAPDPSKKRFGVDRTFRVTLGELAERIRRLHAIRESLTVPDLGDGLMVCLHATYLSFLPEDGFANPVKLNTDNRGWLFELIKSEHFGQIFVSKTLPGITRGNHYHDTKVEKFCVIKGQGVIRFRRIDSDKILEYPVDDLAIKVVDIPPGYTHSIENSGEGEMICLFWANRIFDPERPDTYFTPVVKPG
ncbi:MAG: NAD-dependent epimerase/dehydratase family protein [Syntrophales bacterium]|nr:NAD-dependent epimerase/dehydratase family protein [Syntrophales bacterium]